MSVFAKASASRSRTFKSVVGGIAIVSVSALILSGCASTPEGDDTTGGDTAERDLTLKIGTALPVTGSLDFLGPPEIAGVGLAAKQINDADLGIQIEVTYGDSGDTDNKAYATEVPRLLADGVSAIIGAASSGTSKLFIDDVTGAADSSGSAAAQPLNATAVAANSAIPTPATFREREAEAFANTLMLLLAL